MNLKQLVLCLSFLSACGPEAKIDIQVNGVKEGLAHFSISNGKPETLAGMRFEITFASESDSTLKVDTVRIAKGEETGPEFVSVIKSGDKWSFAREMPEGTRSIQVKTLE